MSDGQGTYAAISFGAPEPPRTISDEALIAYIRAYGPIRFARLVAAFDLEDACEDDLAAHNARILLKRQLQRLRMRGQQRSIGAILRSDGGQRWYVEDL